MHSPFHCSSLARLWRRGAVGGAGGVPFEYGPPALDSIFHNGPCTRRKGLDDLLWIIHRALHIKREKCHWESRERVLSTKWGRVSETLDWKRAADRKLLELHHFAPPYLNSINNFQRFKFTRTIQSFTTTGISPFSFHCRL